MPKKGYKQSPEHLEKNRQARMNHVPSEETREKMRLAHSGEKNHNFGKKFSDETRAKLSASKTGEKHPGYGKHRSEHVRKAIGDAHRGERNHNFGKVLSDDVKEKIRVATSGENNHNYNRKFSEETKEKLALHRLGKVTPIETIIKMRNAQCGDKAHAWKGGISYEPYCPKFNKEFKERVRAFFGHTCQICGRVWVEGEHLMAVHHVNYHKESCCDSNVIPMFVPLCFQPCHTKTNHHREHWEEFFTEIITNKYNGKCYFTLEEMIEKIRCGA